MRISFDVQTRFSNSVEGTRQVGLATAEVFLKGVPKLFATFGYLLFCEKRESLEGYIKSDVSSVSCTFFKAALSVINPDARIEEVKGEEEESESLICSFVSPYLEPAICSQIESCTVASRFLTASYVLVSEIALVADYALGLIAAAFACLSAGSFPKLNQFAKVALENDAKMLDVFCLGLLLTIAPQSFKETVSV